MPKPKRPLEEEIWAENFLDLVSLFLTRALTRRGVPHNSTTIFYSIGGRFIFSFFVCFQICAQSFSGWCCTFLCFVWGTEDCFFVRRVSFLFDATWWWNEKKTRIVCEFFFFSLKMFSFCCLAQHSLSLARAHQFSMSSKIHSHPHSYTVFLSSSFCFCHFFFHFFSHAQQPRVDFVVVVLLFYSFFYCWWRFWQRWNTLLIVVIFSNRLSRRRRWQGAAVKSNS